MQINLEPEQELAIAAAIRAGRFRSREEFVAFAVRLLAGGEMRTGSEADNVSGLQQRDGLWVHCGRLEAGANWEDVVSDFRQERIAELVESSAK